MNHVYFSLETLVLSFFVHINESKYHSSSSSSFDKLSIISASYKRNGPGSATITIFTVFRYWNQLPATHFDVLFTPSKSITEEVFVFIVHVVFIDPVSSIMFYVCIISCSAGHQILECNRFGNFDKVIFISSSWVFYASRRNIRCMGMCYWSVKTESLIVCVFFFAHLQFFLLFLLRWIEWQLCNSSLLRNNKNNNTVGWVDGKKRILFWIIFVDDSETSENSYIRCFPHDSRVR